MIRLVAALLTALVLVPAASPATVDDVQALGYSVAKASDCLAGKDTAGADLWKTTWSVSGFGISTYLSECDPGFQASVDSLADPALHFERRWQHTFPEQLAAASAIASKCYSIGRAAPATDSWRITAVLVDLTVTGAQLVELASTLPDKRVGGSCTAVTAIVPNTGSSGAVTVPGVVKILPVIGPLVPPATTSVTAADVQAAEQAAAEVTELVDELDGGASEAESLRMANAILSAAS